MSPRARPLFLREDGYKIHVHETHPAARLPFHWSVMHDVLGIIGNGRSTSVEYAKHDARSAIREHKDQLEERAA